ncbi:Hypothetical Protein SLY_0873 [Strawberry lethal yellows phytoplasma (CPA) str. NZSb11]|uniref:Uncharacterized protein n=1 Tax=Strawberry lethal yellows phytoplasma (CPA) str. NZSb11 TaxID=980422 RepID=R4S1V8_PHYAS|nr:Hypothetical Protein SLY_0873 [Strawberry lethal yellows phytoplasma (CPA) str. NZSb11]
MQMLKTMRQTATCKMKFFSPGNGRYKKTRKKFLCVYP